MGELLEYINTNDELTVSKPLPHVTTVKWQAGWVGFYLHVSKEELGYYRCIGAIVISRYNINRMDSVEVVNVSRQLHNEKEIIKLLEGMISSSQDLKKFMRNKHDYLNY
jgi:hypothetical protein